MPRTRRRGPIGVGVCRLYAADPGGDHRLLAEVRNSWQYTWGAVAALCLGNRDPAWGLSRVYLEYANVAAPGDTAAVPSFPPTAGVEYYASLAGDPVRDYLRLPVLPPAIDVDPADVADLPAALGNRLTVIAQSAGSAGVNGKPFSAAVNSTICGVAVVAAPVPADPTRDVVFARKYYPTTAQVVVPPNGFRVEYSLSFRLGS